MIRLLLATFFLLGTHLLGQGCVAVRPMSCSASTQLDQTGYFGAGQWQFQTSYRYFESFRHFRGSEEETNRREEGTNVINDAYSMDLGLSRMVTDRTGFSINLPVIYYNRSSLYEHYGNNTTRNPDQLRFSTNASGIGDLRLTTNHWLFDPAASGHKGNIQLGFGIKMPTGDSDVEDDFHRRAADGSDSTIVRPVDQSIQLGDGGWGFNLELQAYRYVGPSTTLYFNGFYLFNPETQNDTLARGTLENVDPLIAYHSIADQYAARGGVNHLLSKRYGIQGSMGFRVEGVPSHDLIGSSNGYRRPGVIVSGEPSLTMPIGQVNLTLSVPFALYRNRTKSVYDLSDPDGERHGDAAFADYLINFTMSYRFNSFFRQG